MANASDPKPDSLSALVLRALRPQLAEILERAEYDIQVRGDARGRFDETTFAKIREEAAERFMAKLKAGPPMTSAELDALWNEVVDEFRDSRFWGHLPTQAPREPHEFQAPASVLSAAKPKKRDPRLENYLRTFLVPTLINKAFILYFGLNYSMYPGEGYGYGLAICVSLTLLSFAYFIYINWDSASE